MLALLALAHCAGGTSAATAGEPMATCFTDT
jgi:hypothetical protein